MTELLNTLLVDQIYQKIKEEVLYKHLEPGKKINPRTISEDYNISVTPVKQALNRLVTEGLVESIPHRGMIVKPLSSKDLQDSLEARNMIELYCVPFILQTAKNDPKFIQELIDNLNEFEIAISEADKTGNYLKQNSLDFQFHALLVSSTRNERICKLYESVGVHMTMFYLYGSRHRERFEECLGEHQEIFQSIQSDDSEVLTKAINSHIANVFKDYNRSLSVINHQ